MRISTTRDLYSRSTSKAHASYRRTRLMEAHGVLAHSQLRVPFHYLTIEILVGVNRSTALATSGQPLP